MNRYKEIYETAIDIRKLEPWTFMDEVDVFGVRIPDSDRVYFLSVMGKLGSWTAISAYRGLEGLAGFYSMQDQGDILPPETILTVPHLMLSFRERDGLSKEQLDSIKSSGLAFRGTGNWPSLELIEPGFLPVLPQGQVLEDALVVFEQALAVLRRSMEGTEFLYEEHETYDSMLVMEQREVAGKKEWIDTYVPLTEMEYAREYKKEVPPEKVEAVFKLPESRNVVQLELALLPAPVKEKGKKGYFPFALFLAEKKSGMMLGMEMLPPLPDLHQMYEKVPETVLDQVLKIGYRPARFEIRSDILFQLTNHALLRAGCRVLGVKNMLAMDDFIRSLTAKLTGESGEAYNPFPKEADKEYDEFDEYDEYDEDFEGFEDEIDVEFEEIYAQFLDADTGQKLDIIDKLMADRPELEDEILDMIGEVGIGAGLSQKAGAARAPGCQVCQEVS